MYRQKNFLGRDFLMKKFLLITLSCLLCVSMTIPALANEWGLRGGVYDIVADDDRYDGYSAIADDGNKQLEGRHVNHAILQNRYHALLIAAQREDNCWAAQTLSTTAVYQPGDPRGEYPNTPSLSHADDGFVLKYGDNGESERYTFVYNQETGDYLLHDVRYSYADRGEWYSDSYILHNEGLLFWQSGPGETFLPIGDALWQTDGITLGEFNIAQTPRSMTEVRNLNFTAAALMEGDALSVHALREGEKNGARLAVYSAPDEASWRAAEGKASVSLGDEVQIYGAENGWTLIGYEVSPRTSRIGFVQAELAGDAALQLASVPLVTQADTFLTDDPFVSQYAHLTLPKGTEITGLAQCGEYYAYVQTQKDGQLIRGFVPLKDLMPKYDRALTTGTELLTADVRWDVIDALTGKWYPADRGSAQEKLVLYADGMYRNHMPGDSTLNKITANFRIYDVEGGDGSTYLMVVRTEDNLEFTYTLRLNEDATITLTNDVTQSVYRRDEYSTFGNG